MNRVPAIKDHPWRDRHGERRELANPVVEESPIGQGHPHAPRADERDGHTERPNAAPEKRLRKEERVKMQRAVKIRRIVMVETLVGDLIHEIAVDAFIEVRGLDREPRQPQGEREQEDARRNPA